MAMIDAPVFPVSTPQAFYDLLLASGSKDPDAMKTFVGKNRGVAAFGGWAATAPWTASYAEERYNSLNSFIFTDASGSERAVRWSLVPGATPVAVSPEDLAKRGPDFLEQDIAARVHGAPQRWSMVVTVANDGDPTADPSKAWPADRRTVEVGTLVVQQIEAEADGPAATSTSIRPSCLLACGPRTIHSRPRGHRHTRSLMIFVPPRPRITPHRNGVPSHDRSSPFYPAAPTSVALADGRLYPGDALHRRRHGVDSHAEYLASYRSTNHSALPFCVCAAPSGDPAAFGAPRCRRSAPPVQKLAATVLSHCAFYALTIGMPLIGWTMLSAAAYPVVLFGGWHPAGDLPQSDSLHALLWDAHFYLAFLLLRPDPAALRRRSSMRSSGATGSLADGPDRSSREARCRRGGVGQDGRCPPASISRPPRLFSKPASVLS